MKSDFINERLGSLKVESKYGNSIEESIIIYKRYW